jgi:hypothetical protein
VVKRYTELHPEVRSLREGIRRLEAKLAALEPKLPANYEPPAARGPQPKPENIEPALAAARSDVEVTTAEIERLENRLKDLEGLMASFTTVRQQYVEIVNKMRDAQAEAARWKARQDEIQMALDAEVAKRRTHLESVQTAETQFRPSSPTLMRVLGFAFVGSLAFGGGVVFLLNFLDRSISTTEEASKYFNIAVHGVIGEITSSGHRRRRKVRRYLVWPAVSLLVLGMLGLATMSIFLWLRSPERFQEWRAAPVKFVWDHAIAAAGQILQRIGS